MSETHDKISELLAEIGRKTSFTPDAVQEFNNMLVQVDKLEKSVVAKDQTIHSLRNDLRSTEKDRDIATKIVSDYKSRERAIKDAEEAAEKLRRDTAVAEGKVAVYQELTGLIFRNTETRREMFGSVPAVNPQYAGDISSVNETITESVT